AGRVGEAGAVAGQPVLEGLAEKRAGHGSGACLLMKNMSQTGLQRLCSKRWQLSKMSFYATAITRRKKPSNSTPTSGVRIALRRNQSCKKSKLNRHSELIQQSFKAIKNNSNTSHIIIISLHRTIY
ncbi:hypothetical protein, partial [Comamonas badia]|uniref:hypothetical protein n=1 Tax=Comamonas badia TaxID=265291 RepID=UPI00146F989A